MSELILFAGGRSRLLVSGEQTQGAWALLGNSQPPGNATPSHLHRREDEVPYVLSGALTIEAGGRKRSLTAGEFAVLPKGQPHRLSNTGPAEATYLLFCAPAGFERFTVEVGECTSYNNEPARPMTDAVRRRLEDIAPSYGIELLDEASLRAEPVGSRNEKVPEIVELIGLSIEVLAETGPEDGDAALLRVVWPPYALIPLHSHPEPECFVVVEGRLDIHVDGTWHHAKPGTHVFVPGGARHAVRNPRASTTTTICATVGSIVTFFRAAGTTPGAQPPGPPSSEQMRKLLETAVAHGQTLYGPEEQAAVGIELGGKA